MLLNWLSRRLAAYLSKQVTRHSVRTSTWQAFTETVQPGDVLLMEGDTRVSVAIKYLTQSTWSHAALYLGPEAGLGESADGNPNVLFEADLQDGIRALPLTFYRHTHIRICRPIKLSQGDLQHLTDYSKSRLGHQYDLKNVWDLARYLCPTPPVPSRYRRSLLALGSGDPTRAICSTFIAQGFQALRYPILPVSLADSEDDPDERAHQRECFRIRHHSLFAPRDFDASPYFDVVKPTIAKGFNYRQFDWAD